MKDHAAYELFLAVSGSLPDNEHGRDDGSDQNHADEPASPSAHPAGVARFWGLGAGTRQRCIPLVLQRGGISSVSG